MVNKIERVEHGCMEPESAIGYALADARSFILLLNHLKSGVCCFILNLPEEKSVSFLLSGRVWQQV